MAPWVSNETQHISWKCLPNCISGRPSRRTDKDFSIHRCPPGRLSRCPRGPEDGLRGVLSEIPREALAQREVHARCWGAPPGSSHDVSQSACRPGYFRCGWPRWPCSASLDPAEAEKNLGAGTGSPVCGAGGEEPSHPHGLSGCDLCSTRCDRSCGPPGATRTRRLSSFTLAAGWQVLQRRGTLMAESRCPSIGGFGARITSPLDGLTQTRSSAFCGPCPSLRGNPVVTDTQHLEGGEQVFP